MKYIIIILLMFLTSCQNNKYDEYVNYLENQKENYIDIVDIELEFIELNEETMYKVTIDNPKEKMFDVEALVIHDYETNDIFPSFGIFEEKYNLYNEKIDDSYTKGIILIGYIKEFDSNKNFKILIRYKDENSNNKEFIKYIK